MVGRVPPRASSGIVLMDAAQQRRRTVQPMRNQPLGEGLEINRQEVDQIVEAALFDRHRPIHERLEEVKAWADKGLPMQCRVVQADADTASRLPLENMECPAGVDHLKSPN